jgi:class 3 adenylate cyclase
MLHYIHFADPKSGEMTDYLDSIPVCPGICFFMDINKSTDMKYEGGLKYWGRKLNNTFNYLLYSNHFEKNVVKGIGDEIMLFIPDYTLRKKSANNSYFAVLEDIYAALYLIKNHPERDLFLHCKVAIHYCTDVYNISFFEGANDYYGSDVDLTARLMGKSKENRIVLSERYYNKVLEDLTTLQLPPDTGCLKLVSQIQSENFKGVPDAIQFRYIDI